MNDKDQPSISILKQLKIGYERPSFYFYKTPLPPQRLLLGPPILMDPHPSQQHAAGIQQHAVCLTTATGSNHLVSEKSKKEAVKGQLSIVFLNGPNSASFSLFLFFSHDKCSTNLTINDKSIDAMLGTRTRGGKMVSAYESNELQRPPPIVCYFITQRCRI